MAVWSFYKYCTTPYTYLMMAANQPLVEQQQFGQGGDYGAVGNKGVDEEKGFVPFKEHRETLQGIETKGPAPNVAHFYREPKTFTRYAVLSTIFCCFPLGIPAIYYSQKAKKLSLRGERLSAQRAAQRSRQLIQMAVSIGLVLWFIALIVIITVTHPKP